MQNLSAQAIVFLKKCKFQGYVWFLPGWYQVDWYDVDTLRTQEDVYGLMPNCTTKQMMEVGDF